MKTRQFKTIADVQQFVDANSDTIPSTEDVQWFVAIVQAKEMLDSYSLRDWAHTIQDGIKKQTKETTEDWLDYWYDNYETEYANILIIELLNEHFG